MRCKVWIFTLFGGKLQYKKRYRKRHNCIIYGICYGVGDGTRTHNAWNHNPVLCQLNYTHHIKFAEAALKSGTPGGTRSIKERLRRAVAGNARPRCIELFSSAVGGTGKMARQKGLEPLTYCLEGSCSIQLSYWRMYVGAGDGNRTRVSSLEGWCSTIELHPQALNL